MKVSEAKTRREVVTDRILQIDAELAAAKAAWFANGTEGSMARRTSLEAERARLMVERNTLHKTIEANKTAQKIFRSTLAHAVLINMLIERGLGELVVQADRIAMDSSVNAQQEQPA